VWYQTTVHTPTVHTHVWYQTTVHTPTVHTHVWYQTTVHTPTIHTHVWYQTTVHTPTIHTHVWYCTKHRTYLAEKKIIIFRDTPSHWQHKSTKLLLSTIWYMTSRCYPRALLFARFNLWAALVTFLESFGGNHRNQTDRMHPVDRQFDMPDSDK